MEQEREAGPSSSDASGKYAWSSDMERNPEKKLKLSDREKSIQRNRQLLIQLYKNSVKNSVEKVGEMEDIVRELGSDCFSGFFWRTQIQKSDLCKSPKGRTALEKDVMSDFQHNINARRLVAVFLKDSGITPEVLRLYWKTVGHIVYNKAMIKGIGGDRIPEKLRDDWDATADMNEFVGKLRSNAALAEEETLRV